LGKKGCVQRVLLAGRSLAGRVPTAAGALAGAPRGALGHLAGEAARRAQPRLGLVHTAHGRPPAARGAGSDGHMGAQGVKGMPGGADFRGRDGGVGGSQMPGLGVGMIAWGKAAGPAFPAAVWAQNRAALGGEAERRGGGRQGGVPWRFGGRRLARAPAAGPPRSKIAPPGGRAPRRRARAAGRSAAGSRGRLRGRRAAGVRGRGHVHELVTSHAASSAATSDIVGRTSGSRARHARSRSSSARGSAGGGPGARPRETTLSATPAGERPGHAGAPESISDSSTPNE
jgi:hypothetical protein